MEATRTSEMSIDFQWAPRHYIEYRILHTHRCVNFRSYEMSRYLALSDIRTCLRLPYKGKGTIYSCVEPAAIIIWKPLSALSRDCVTIDGVWIGSRIYWTLKHATHDCIL
jgi:hypothetical protein